VIVVLAAMAAATSSGLLLHARSADAAQRVAGLCLRALLWVFVPFVIVVSLPRLHADAGLAAGLGLGYVAAGATGLAAYVIGARILKLPRACTGTLIVAALVMNATYMGYPFVGALLGKDAVPEAIAFDALVNGPLFYVVGFAVGAAFGGHDVARREVLLRNPPLYAAVIGLALPASAIPGALVDVSHGVVWVLLALGFVALGVTLASEARPQLDRTVAVAVGLRVLVAPALYLGLTAVIGGGVPTAFRIEEAMPVGINLLVVAHATGLDLRVASSAIAWSTLVVASWGLVASIA
jgi:predicted permease